MKRIYMVACLSIFILLLCLCSNRSAKKIVKLDPDNPTEITAWHYYNGKQQDVFNALVEEFNRTEGKGKGIIVVPSSQGNVYELEDNVRAAVNKEVGAEKVPQIFAAYADTAYEIDQLGLVADISSYFTQEQLEQYIDGYLEEGYFFDHALKIFPIAKATEVLILNETDWEQFAKETGATTEAISTMEGLTVIAQKYYEWTDSLTEEPNDGKAFFGRDAMANYFIIGAKQLGVEIFQVKNGNVTLNFNEEVMRKLWDNFYIPYIKGYFTAKGKFRSDDMKTGELIAYVGSSASATYIPKEVVDDTDHLYKIQAQVLEAPSFEHGEKYRIQQGAGMVVTKGSEAEVYASVEFLKWFTQREANLIFSVESGYMPVTYESIQQDVIMEVTEKLEVEEIVEETLHIAISSAKDNELYTTKPFKNGSDMRSVLEFSMMDKAIVDKETINQNMTNSMSYEQAMKPFTEEENFKEWYEGIKASLEELAN